MNDSKSSLISIVPPIFYQHVRHIINVEMLKLFIIYTIGTLQASKAITTGSRRRIEYLFRKYDQHVLDSGMKLLFLYTFAYSGFY